MHDLIKHALATAQIVYFIEAFQADSYGEISYTLHILAEFFIDQGAVGKCMEATVIVFLAQTDDVILSDQRFATGEEIQINAKLLTLGNDTVHIFKA